MAGQNHIQIFLNSGKKIETLAGDAINWLDTQTLARQISKCDMVAETRARRVDTAGATLYIAFINGAFYSGAEGTD